MEEALVAGSTIKSENILFDEMFTSKLVRAQITGKIILEAINQSDISINQNIALNERNYGSLAGLNKDDARKKWGEEQVHIWRRSFDIPPPDGESLKNTSERVLPYFNREILPKVVNGSNILIAAHGNSLRSLIMQLDDISEVDIVNLEIPTGAPIKYVFNEDGSILEKTNLY